MNNLGKILIAAVFCVIIGLGYYFNPQRKLIIDLKNEMNEIRLEFAKIKANSPSMAGAVPLPPANRVEGDRLKSNPTK